MGVILIFVSMTVLGAGVAFFGTSWVVNHTSTCPPRPSLCGDFGVTGFDAGVLGTPLGGLLGAWVTQRWLSPRLRRWMARRAA
jgi:hypothetical protein